MWPSKPEVLTSPTEWQISPQFQWHIWGFRPRPVRRNWPRAIAMTTDNRKWQCVSKTGNTYTSETMVDRMTVLTANCGFLTTPSSERLTLRDCNNNRQQEIAICTFCSPISQFMAVVRCRNHLDNPLSSSTSSKIQDLPLEFRRILL